MYNLCVALPRKHVTHWTVLSMMEAQAITAHLVGNFEFSPDPNAKNDIAVRQITSSQSPHIDLLLAYSHWTDFGSHGPW